MNIIVSRVGVEVQGFLLFFLLIFYLFFSIEMIEKMHNNFVGLVTNLSDFNPSADNATKIKKKEKLSEYGVLAKITGQAASISYNSFDR